MSRVFIAIMITIVCLAITAVAIVFAAVSSAGIGPNGFAFYARQGILHAIDMTYGKGNNPYTVHCQDHPNFITLNDNVTCQIRQKP